MLRLEDLLRIAEIEFINIVSTNIKYENKIRIILVDGSFIDIYLLQRIENRFGFH